MWEVFRHLVQWITDRWPYTVATVLIISFLLTKTFPVLKAWLDFRIQEVHLNETELNVEQLNTESQLVEIADLDEIRNYDPKPSLAFERLQQQQDPDSTDGLPVLPILAIVLVLIALFVWLF